MLSQFLLALKEKNDEIEFFDNSMYIESEMIGKSATSSVKIVIKREGSKYAKKELKEFTHNALQRFIAECEALFRLRHPCIVRVHSFSYGDDTHPQSMILSLEPNSLESSISKKELSNEEKKSNHI